MKKFDINNVSDPVYNSVTGLFNITFDPKNYVVHRGATEGQIKIIYDMIKALQDWLDEFGCNGDPFAIIKAKVDELEAVIDECCANPQDLLIQMLNDRMDGIEVAMDNCCRAMDDNLYQMLVDRLDALEQSIEDCCKGGSGGGSGGNTNTCDGNTITVSYSWNGANPIADGGKATATSSVAGSNIVSFQFLVKEGGVYLKTSQASGRGPDWGWTIDSSGNMRASYGTWSSRIAVGIVATDSNGCEGMTPISLPGGSAVGG